MNANDIRVRNLTSQDQLMPEALNGFVVAGELRANDFESNELFYLAVLCLVDRSHASLAKKFENFVALAENLSRLQNRCGALSACVCRFLRRGPSLCLRAGWA